MITPSADLRAGTSHGTCESRSCSSPLGRSAVQKKLVKTKLNKKIKNKKPKKCWYRLQYTAWWYDLWWWWWWWWWWWCMTIQTKANEQYIAWLSLPKEPLLFANCSNSFRVYMLLLKRSLLSICLLDTAYNWSRVLLNRPYWLEPIWSLCLLVSQESPKFFRKPRYKDIVHLWEFLLELLAKEDCRSVISWVCKERSEFKIENPQELAKKWGAFKNKGATNYENLSRSLRFYYRQGILKKVGWVILLLQLSAHILWWVIHYSHTLYGWHYICIDLTNQMSTHCRTRYGRLHDTIGCHSNILR